MVGRWLNEGSEYRVNIDIEAGSPPLTVNVRPPTFERLALEIGSEVQVLILQESIHLISEME
jgi:molybdate/tungstate transport system ATP-binding protein